MIGYNILPIGFSSYERSMIETFFRLAGRRAPHWGLTTQSNEARVLLFNVTSAQDVESFRSLVASWQKIIIVGNSDYGTGWLVLPRPIKLTAILTLLDDIANFKTSEIAQPAITVSSAAVAAVPIENKLVALPQATKLAAPEMPAPEMPATVSKVAKLAASTPAAAFEKPSMTDVFASITTPVDTRIAPQRQPAIPTKKIENAKPAPVPMDEAPSFVASSSSVDQIAKANEAALRVAKPELGRVLLVDDSDIALKYMQNRLRHFSYDCDMVRSGEEALAMVATHSYKFVFLDVMMAGLDGYQTCKAIKNNKARRGSAPVVVMLTSKGGTIDKIRGSMAGCDAYLTKPLNDKKLAVVLTKYDDSTATERWEAANPRQPLVNTLGTTFGAQSN
jgi:two-component system, cell cycle response regulator